MSGLRIPVNDDDHGQGRADALVTLVEYGDYQCPYCGEAYGVVKDLQRRFGGDLRLVFRNFPLSDMHPQALPAAVVAEYAGSHGRFWEAHDALYENQRSLGSALYAELLRELGLPLDGLRQAMDDNAFEARIQADLDGGIRSGVNGTPSFFINGQRYDVRGGFEDLANPIAALIERGGR